MFLWWMEVMEPGCGSQAYVSNGKKCMEESCHPDGQYQVFVGKICGNVRLSWEQLLHTQ